MKKEASPSPSKGGDVLPPKKPPPTPPKGGELPIG